MSPPRTYQDEPAVSDYRRSVAGYDSGPDRNSGPDREISLSTPSILGLFFALAIVCGCIYALGFAMGRRSTPTIPAAVMDTSLAPATGSPKPDAGQPPAADSAPSAVLASDATATPALQPSAMQTAQTLAVPLAPSTTPAAPATSAAASSTSSAAPPAFMVQVAAVSSQDVADILIASLRKKGYAVAVHPGPQDKLLHVQIGPFPDRAAAEAMRQRVLADGFNAIVK